MSPRENLFLVAVKNKTSYVLLLVLCMSQILASLQTHSLVARLTLCDTILFTIATARHLFSNTKQNLEVFLRLAGIIAFEALIFVNFTHGLEIVFAEPLHTHISRMRFNSSLYFFHQRTLLALFLLVTAADVILKTVFTALGLLPMLELNWKRRLALHYLCTGSVITLKLIDYKFSTDKTNLLAIIDPYLGLVISIILTIVTYPAGKNFIIRKQV